MKYLLAMLVLLAAFCPKSHAQYTQVNATLDKPYITLGEQTQLRLSVKFHIKDSIGFPVLADSIARKIQIVGVKADTTFDKSNVFETIRRSYTVTGFDSGDYEIPSYAFKTPGGILKTDSLLLQVKTVAVDTTKAIYDIKQPLAVQYSFLDWLRDNWQLVVYPLLGLLAIGGLAYYFWKKPKKEVVVEEVKPAVPAHIIALEKLNEIKAKNLWQQQQVKQYYIELSDVIREYLEQRYTIQALEQTSDEIFASLKYADISGDNRNLLRQLLILSDLVKFAKEKPLAFENEKSMENAVAFVNGSQNAPQPLDKREGKA